MSAVRFRVPLTRQEVQGGQLIVFPAFQFFAPHDLSPQEFWLEEAAGRSIPVKLVTIHRKVNTIFGRQDVEQTAFDLKGWYKKHALRRGGSLLITVLDWEKGRFRWSLNLLAPVKDTGTKSSPKTRRWPITYSNS